MEIKLTGCPKDFNKIEARLTAAAALETEEKNSGDNHCRRIPIGLRKQETST